MTALSHELKGIVFIRQSLSCDSPIESGYYSNRLKKPPICYYCGKNNLLSGGKSFFSYLGKKKVGELTRENNFCII
ncbi:hypothetical protein C1646_770600 [Rhizophagus diaphanus]|nr:hypothetical protein C1646_770600 [Rhizophagus diaphanus] [Rhizophagus sp. MUCL 43196]